MLNPRKLMCDTMPIPHPPGDTFRAFIAISVPGHVKKELIRIQALLKKEKIHAAWPRPDAFHLTLKFLGNIREETVSRILGAMKPLRGTYPDLELTAGSLGVFPGIKKARVAWAGIGGQTDRLAELFHTLETNLALIGIKKEKRRFSPHFTLARIKQPVRPEKWIGLMDQCKQMRTPPFPVQQIHLFESRLNPAGAVHTRLFSVKLS